MTVLAQASHSKHASIWLPILGYSALLFLIYGTASFLVEVYSGSCMFIIPTYFYALVVSLAIFKLKRFGVGTALFLLFIPLGVFMDYIGDWVVDKNLINPWYALGWAPVFLGFGFAADLAYRFAPARWPARWSAVTVGAVFGLAFYLLVLFALITFYSPSGSAGHLRFFTTGLPFSLPWIVITSGFGGYTAYAISEGV